MVIKGINMKRLSLEYRISRLEKLLDDSYNCEEYDNYDNDLELCDEGILDIFSKKKKPSKMTQEEFVKKATKYLNSIISYFPEYSHNSNATVKPSYDKKYVSLQFINGVTIQISYDHNHLNSSIYGQGVDNVKLNLDLDSKKISSSDLKAIKSVMQKQAKINKDSKDKRDKYTKSTSQANQSNKSKDSTFGNWVSRKGDPYSSSWT